MDFGAAQAERLVVRKVHMCLQCWDPLQGVGTKEIVVFGCFDVERDVGMRGLHTEAERRRLDETEVRVLASFGGGGRGVTVEMGFVGWK